MADGSDDEGHEAEAQAGLERARELLEAADTADLTAPLDLDGPPEDGVHMLILDEVLYAADRGLIEENDVLELIEEKPDNLELVLSGSHEKPAYLEDHVDLLTNVRKDRHPIDHGQRARGPEDGIELPFTDRRVDHEIELAFVMGEDVKDIDAEDVWDAVLGYTILLDVSVRGDQDRSNRKSYDTFTIIGPCVATPDEVGDPHDLEMELQLNGETKQQQNTGGMIYSCADVVEYASIGATIEAAGQWLRLEDVESRAADAALLERFDKRVLVCEFAAADVDQDRIAAHDV